MARRWLERSLDNLGASLGGLVYRKNLLFSHSLESKPLGEVTRRTVAKISSFPIREWQQVMANGPVGNFNTAFLVYDWQDFSAPTLLFIQSNLTTLEGLALTPSKASLQKVLARR